ncbi:putative Cyclohexanone monooxygenase [Seiridium cardinale]
MTTIELDALVVGAGFGGIYQLHRLVKKGLRCKTVEVAGGVGGTWYWNKYPGCMSDSWSVIYRYSWDKDDLQNYPWPNNYVTRDEIIGYLNHVVDKHELRKYMQFNTALTSAEWKNDRWAVTCSSGDVYSVKYLFTALGLLSHPKYPDIPGISNTKFLGKLMHGSSWDPSIDLKGKRVGVIGCGSTGIQITTAIAADVKELHCFIRHPQYTTPSGLRPVPPDERRRINETYEKIWDENFNSALAFAFTEANRETSSVSEEEREQILEDLWQQGNGFNFLFGGFGDTMSNEEANEEVCKFIRRKIAQTVKDPAKAAVLTPHDLFVRRPPCDNGYYDKFNREHVFAIDVETHPIVAVEEKGLRTADGKIHELDVIVFATGFDAVDGSYQAITGDIKGRDGALLSERWRSGPTTYLGLMVPQFPNLFLVNGPQGVFANQPTGIEAQVNFVMEILTEMEARDADVVEATAEAGAQWVELCNSVATHTLFNRVRSWVTGANVAGKEHQTRFYFGGVKSYLAILDEIRANHYKTLGFAHSEPQAQL